MFKLSVLLVFGVIINANGHLLTKMLHNLHTKFHPNNGHHSGIFVHSGPGRYPPFGPQSQSGPEYGPYGPPPFGFPPHHAPHQHSPHYHNCQNQPCHFPYPNNGQLPYPSFNPHHAPNHQSTPINTPNTININNINANSQQDATSISSVPIDFNVPNYPTGHNHAHNHKHGSDVLTNSQSVYGGNQADIYHGQTQPLPSIAGPNAYPTNNHINNNHNNAYPSSTSQNNLNEFTSNGLTNSLSAHTTSLNAHTTNLNAQTTTLNGYSNNANQFGIDSSTFNAMDNNLFNGATATQHSNNVNNLNNNNNNVPVTVTRPQTRPTYTELPPVTSTTNRAGMEYDIDIRFGDNETKN